MNSVSGGILSVEELLTYVRNQLDTRAKTITCRVAIQLTYLSGDEIHGSGRGAYSDAECITSLIYGLETWVQRVGIVEQRLKDDSIPEDWSENLERLLFAHG